MDKYGKDASGTPGRSTRYFVDCQHLSPCLPLHAMGRNCISRLDERLEHRCGMLEPLRRSVCAMSVDSNHVHTCPHLSSMIFLYYTRSGTPYTAARNALLCANLAAANDIAPPIMTAPQYIDTSRYPDLRSSPPMGGPKRPLRDVSVLPFDFRK